MLAMPKPDAGPHERRGRSYEPSLRASKAQLGMAVFLGSLTVLFATCLLAMVLTRLGGAAWPEPEVSELPRGLLVSTALMVALSGSLHRAVGAVRKNRQKALVGSLNWAFGLGVLFVAAQSLNWMQVSARDLASERPTLYPFTFYFLTGLHAGHVSGGLVALWLIGAKARQVGYSSSNHEPVRLCAQYWHFLGIVWVVLAVALFWMG
jgi:cytochrome c oxidase subunit 3